MDVLVKDSDKDLDNSMNVIFNMLDEALDEYERGEFISEEELFRELKNINWYAKKIYY